jgi:hypothetical protein
MSSNQQVWVVVLPVMWLQVLGPEAARANQAINQSLYAFSEA